MPSGERKGGFWGQKLMKCGKMQRQNFKKYLKTQRKLQKKSMSIFIPFLEHYSEQLKTRFIEHGELLSKIQSILPKKCTELDVDGIRSKVETFEAEWPNDFPESMDDFMAEMTMCKRQCLKTPNEKQPKTFVAALNKCDSMLYPSIHRFLKIGATLPVSVAESERSFSSL